jgi:hypothetical protein
MRDRQKDLAAARRWFERPFDERMAAGLQLLRQQFPDAPEAMLRTAGYHLWDEGPDAALALLAETERALEEEDDTPLLFGAQWEVIYHIYNWLQLQALMPVGTLGLLEDVEEVKLSVEAGNTKAALKVLDQLLDRLQGHVDPPDLP